jgi:hypothetical protein
MIAWTWNDEEKENGIRTIVGIVAWMIEDRGGWQYSSVVVMRL